MLTHENQVRIVFLYWLPCILRMQRPGGGTGMEYPPTPTSDASERKATNIQDVELRERYDKLYSGIVRQELSTHCLTKALIETMCGSTQCLTECLTLANKCQLQIVKIIAG